MNEIDEVIHLVIACNHPLRSVVQTMSPIILLRNLHPLYRSDYAHRFLYKGIINKVETLEFVKIP